MKKNKVNENFVQFINIKKRQIVDLMLTKMNKYIDVIIPRGGKNLVKKVQNLSSVPTIGHLEGICHSYVDKDANPKIAKRIIHNAKLRNTSICGATETILLHEKILKKIGNQILKDLEENGCTIIGDNKIRKIYNGKIKKASLKDWSKEYLASIVSVKSVNVVVAFCKAATSSAISRKFKSTSECVKGAFFSVIEPVMFALTFVAKVVTADPVDLNFISPSAMLIFIPLQSSPLDSQQSLVLRKWYQIMRNYCYHQA